MTRAKHISAWFEDVGNVLWWTNPVDEPPYVGTPIDNDWPGCHEWWTPLPAPPTKFVMPRAGGFLP